MRLFGLKSFQTSYALRSGFGERDDVQFFVHPCKAGFAHFGKNHRGGLLALLLALVLSLTACGSVAYNDVGGTSTESTAEVEEESAGGGTRDNTPQVLVPEASGAEVYTCDEVSLDVSNCDQGYFMIAYTGSSSKVRMLVETPEGNTYNYLMSLDGEYAVYPFSEGDGSYSIGVYENISDDQYAQVFSQSVSVSMADENLVYLYPNAYVNFDASTKAVAKGSEIVASADTDLDAVALVYAYVIGNITYDYDKAETVQSGYVPDVDDTLSTGMGICFDYSSLMATMLRSQGIPTRLEIGYVDDIYHAWISIYTEETGWIEGMISFDGTDWTLVDPTLASYAQDSTIKDHMDNADTYYEVKYKY